LKLIDFSAALKAAEKALEIDDSYIKAYAKKGNAHFGMREYHKALEAFQRGLTVEPNNAEFQEGVRKTHMKLYSGNETKEEAEDRARHAMADPEIQRILADPSIQILLRKLQENPNDKETMRALQDPVIS
jgi:stress-induced-phosphoprotein 1